jgi:hypothetical protein
LLTVELGCYEKIQVQSWSSDLLLFFSVKYQVRSKARTKYTSPGFGGWADGWMVGWMDGGKSGLKGCLAQTNKQFQC